MSKCNTLKQNCYNTYAETNFSILSTNKNESLPLSPSAICSGSQRSSAFESVPPQAKVVIPYKSWTQSSISKRACHEGHQGMIMLMASRSVQDEYPHVLEWSGGQIRGDPSELCDIRRLHIHPIMQQNRYSDIRPDQQNCSPCPRKPNDVGRQPSISCLLTPQSCWWYFS